ncbi:MAG TPA: hypothetical protein VMG12_11385 [Polyangiaceae bacterium]|nr:hypothetical protein [Polyangiaceae bacterium]
MKKRERWFGPLGRALVGLAIIAACSGRAENGPVAGGDSESHFLSHCVPGSCEEGLACLFGICTALCTDDADCSSWSGASVCRAVDASNDPSAVCDVECSDSADCTKVGAGLGCDAGRCRTASEKARALGFSCTSDDGCAAGLRCVSNLCTSRCEDDSECSDGASCEYFTDVSRASDPDYTMPDLSCVLPCSLGVFESSHDECAALGPGGRCKGERCVETLTGQCGDIGQPDARWACYESLAPDLFRERQPALLEQTLCLPTTNGRYGDVDFLRCPEGGCDAAGGACAVNGLVLESSVMPEPIANGGETIVMIAKGELRLREPMRVPFELTSPVERCEYSVDLRFWGLEFYDTIGYFSPFSAQSILENLEPSPPLSLLAIERGYAQPVRSIGFGHTGVRDDRAIIVEDSEASVTLLSGGSRCESIRELVGIGLRVSLVDPINNTLYNWFAAQYASVDCTICGTLGCELACQRR